MKAIFSPLHPLNPLNPLSPPSPLNAALDSTPHHKPPVDTTTPHDPSYGPNHDPATHHFDAGSTSQPTNTGTSYHHDSGASSSSYDSGSSPSSTTDGGNSSSSFGSSSSGGHSF